jgi:hypothetical protein
VQGIIILSTAKEMKIINWGEDFCIHQRIAPADRWGYPGVDGRIMLGWIFKKWDVGVRTGLGWLRVRIRGGRL